MDTATAAPQDRLADLRASAKGWHGVQLAALGFIGLCGVIQTGDETDPWALQVISGVLVLVAFVLACAGIYLVGRAAWPLYRGEAAPAADQRAVDGTSRLLTRGLLMTFLSVACVALATTASWWPKEDGGGADGAGAAQVRVQTSDGRSACGELGDAPQAGTLRIRAGSQSVDVALGSLASVVPVRSC